MCLKCLEKDPADRYPGASELAVDLERNESSAPIDAEDMIAEATAEEVADLGDDKLMEGSELPEGEAIVDLADAKDRDDFAVLAEAELQEEIESEEV